MSDKLRRVIVDQECYYCKDPLVVDLLEPDYGRYSTFYLNDPIVGAICQKCLAIAGYRVTQLITTRNQTQYYSKT